MSKKGPKTIEFWYRVSKEFWYFPVLLLIMIVLSNASGSYREIYLGNEYVVEHRWTWWGLFWEETDLQYRKVELSDHGSSEWHYRNSKGEWIEMREEFYPEDYE